MIEQLGFDCGPSGRTARVVLETDEPLDDTLVSRYRFESDGTTIEDQVSDNIGEIRDPDVTTRTTSVDMEGAQSLKIGDTTSPPLISTNTELNNVMDSSGGSVSISFKFDTSISNNGGGLIGKGDGTNAYGLYVTDTGNLGYVWKNSNDSINDVFVDDLDDGNVHTVAMSYNPDANVVNIIVDGNEMTDFSVTGGASNNGDVKLGWSSLGSVSLSGTYKGYVDDLRFYNELKNEFTLETYDFEIPVVDQGVTTYMNKAGDNDTRIERESEVYFPAEWNDVDILSTVREYYQKENSILFAKVQYETPDELDRDWETIHYGYVNSIGNSSKAGKMRLWIEDGTTAADGIGITWSTNDNGDGVWTTEEAAIAAKDRMNAASNWEIDVGDIEYQEEYLESTSDIVAFFVKAGTGIDIQQYAEEKSFKRNRDSVGDLLDWLCHMSDSYWYFDYDDNDNKPYLIIDSTDTRRVFAGENVNVAPQGTKFVNVWKNDVLNESQTLNSLKLNGWDDGSGEYPFVKVIHSRLLKRQGKEYGKIYEPDDLNSNAKVTNTDNAENLARVLLKKEIKESSGGELILEGAPDILPNTEIKSSQVCKGERSGLEYTTNDGTWSMVNPVETPETGAEFFESNGTGYGEQQKVTLIPHQNSQNNDRSLIIQAHDGSLTSAAELSIQIDFNEPIDSTDYLETQGSDANDEFNSSNIKLDLTGDQVKGAVIDADAFTDVDFSITQYDPDGDRNETFDGLQIRVDEGNVAEVTPNGTIGFRVDYDRGQKLIDPASLISYWTFDYSDSPDKITDTEGINHGEINDTNKAYYSFQSQLSRRSLNIDEGGKGTIYHDNTLQYAYDGDGTTSFFFFLDKLPDDKALITEKMGSNDGWQIWCDPNGNIYADFKKGGSFDDEDVFITQVGANEGTYIALRFHDDEGHKAFYKNKVITEDNGIGTANLNLNHDDYSNQADLLFGSETTVVDEKDGQTNVTITNEFEGWIDEYRIYDEGLTKEQIEILANNPTTRIGTNDLDDIQSYQINDVVHNTPADGVYTTTINVSTLIDSYEMTITESTMEPL